MKIIAALFALGLTFLSAAQLPADSWAYGTWIKQGYAFEGSFYPVNSWNAEKLVLNEDYSLQKTVGEIEGNQIMSVLYEGKWSYSTEYKKLRFYKDEERFSQQGKIITFDTEYDVDFSSRNYFTIKEKKGNYIVETRFQREGTTESFEESVIQENERLADLALKFDPNSRVFYMVNSFDLTKRKPMYFNDKRFSFSHSVYNENDEIDYRSTDFTGTITDFTDSSIFVNVESETIHFSYSDGIESTINREYYSHQDGFVKQEFKLKDLDYAYRYKSNSIAPITFTVSAITTLLVAPLISINYKTGDFNKSRYYTTAGIGLAGIAASIPLAIIFNRRKPVRFIPMGADVEKSSWYLQKSPR